MRQKRRKPGHALEQDMYEAVHHAIAERRLPSGTKLAEEQIAEVFGVSRARARGVLQRLASDKVVTLERNRGAFVSEPSPVEARQVFAARKIVEVALAYELVKVVDDAAITRLRAHVEREEAAERGDNRRDELKTSHDFHTLLAGLLGNPDIEAFVAELAARSTLITAIYERPDADICSHVSHGQLISLLERRDGQALANAMRDHLEEIESQLVLTDRGPSNVDLRKALLPHIAQSSRRRGS